MPIQDCNNTLEVKKHVCDTANDMEEMIVNPPNEKTTNFNADPISKLVQDRMIGLAPLVASDYIWANQAERTSQTGMLLNQTGVQVDTQAFYKYDGSTWVLIGTNIFIKPTDEVKQTGQNWDGANYIDPDAIGANASAKIYPSGVVKGTTDNGTYTKYPDGNFKASAELQLDLTTAGTQSLGNLPVKSVALTDANISLRQALLTADVEAMSKSFPASISNISFQMIVSNTVGVTNNVLCRMKVAGEWK